jgi:tetratricopeptide (TPR) repeat protein
MISLTLEEIDYLAKESYYNDDLPNALRYYAEAFIRIPNLGLAYNNYGSILREMGFPQEAKGFFETAMRIDNDDRNAPFNYAVAHLAAGELNKGWELFEARWRFKYHEHTLEGWSKPRWNGEDITGKRLLITCEEGDGDNIQFIRYAHTLKEMGVIPIIQTEINLVDLFATSFPDYEVVTNKVVYEDFDYWSPLMSVPKCLKITFDNFPQINNYIKLDKKLINKWKKIVGKSNKPRIGYSCKGNSKSYPMEMFSKFMKNNPQYDYVNLQASYTEEETLMVQGANIFDYFEHIRVWNDTAGLLYHLDCVISVDTGLAHLAGAMGKKTILLLDRYKTCWRWLYDTPTTPWYPSMHLVRQKDVRSYEQQLNDVTNLLPHP